MAVCWRITARLVRLLCALYARTGATLKAISFNVFVFGFLYCHILSHGGVATSTAFTSLFLLCAHSFAAFWFPNFIQQHHFCVCLYDYNALAVSAMHINSMPCDAVSQSASEPKHSQAGSISFG